MPTHPRQHYIDALRVFAFLLVIPFHTAMLYTSFGWEVKAVERLGWIDYPVIWLHQWRLPLLLLVSGMGVRIAIANKTYGHFLKERTLRLAIPFLVCIPLVLMPQQFISLVYQGFIQKGSVADFTWDYLRLFKNHPELYHLWFIEYLFCITVVLSPILYFSNNLSKQYNPSNTIKTVLWLAWLVSIVTLETILRPLFPETNDITTDWANISLFTHFFIAVFFLQKEKEIFQFLAKWSWVFLTLGAGLLVLEVLNYLEIIPKAGLSTPLRIIGILAFILGLCGFAFAHFQQPNRWVNYLNKSLYPVYLWHQTIICIVGYLVAETHLAAGFQYLVVLSFTVLICYSIYEGMLKRWQWVGFLFGLKPENLNIKTGPWQWVRLIIATLFLAFLYFWPISQDHSLTRPVTINSKYAGNNSVNFSVFPKCASLIQPILIADFADWAYIPLQKEGDNYYYRTKLKPGTYQYKFVLNGVYQLDPTNPKCQMV
jgi:glucans biosynthesis protein C